MIKLFETEEDFKKSGYLFRITDNGGETADRFTIITCDGDYFASSADPHFALGFFQSGENINVQGTQERIENGEERDLRWIDLPEDVRQAVIGRLNDGFSDYLANEDCANSRDEVKEEFSGGYDGIGKGIYRCPEGFRIADENSQGDAADDPGPFATFREAVLHTLPQECDLSGPEYHTTRDLWGDEGGPAPLWDRDETEEEEEEIPCPNCEGAGGFGDKGTCGICEGRGSIPADKLAETEKFIRYLSNGKGDEK